MTKTFFQSYVLLFQLAAYRKIYPVSKQIVFFSPGTSSCSPCIGGREHDNIHPDVTQILPNVTVKFQKQF